MSEKPRDLTVFVGPIRMNADDHEALKARAAVNERSVAAEIRLAVRKYLKAEVEA